MNFLLENEKFYNPTNHCVSMSSDGAGSDQGMVTRESGGGETEVTAPVCMQLSTSLTLTTRSSSCQL